MILKEKEFRCWYESDVEMIFDNYHNKTMKRGKAIGSSNVESVLVVISNV